MRNEPMPAGLNGAEQILFQSLRLLYQNHKSGAIPRELASKEKRDLVEAYKHNLSDLEVWQSSVKMWARIELAATRYAHDRTVENADKFVEAVYGCRLKEAT